MRFPGAGIPRPLVNKQVSFRYQDETLVFNLTQTLFSSFSVDRGSKLLLKTIARAGVLDRCTNLLDYGCGTGVLAISLKKCRPNLALLAVDRDALAMRMTRENSELNSIEGAQIQGSVGLHAGCREWDLIVCNLPAKAGHPVIEELLSSFAESLSASGIAAVVVVKPLESLLSNFLERSEIDVVCRDGTNDHTVFHYRYRARNQPSGVHDLDPFIRRTMLFEARRMHYRLSTVFGLPDFDTIGTAAHLAIELADDCRLGGDILFWNPGQGHTALFANAKNGQQIDRYILAGRDLLALEITKKNLEAADVEPHRISIVHTAFLSDLDLTAGSIICRLNRDSDLYSHNSFLSDAAGRIDARERLVIVGGSTAMHRLLGDNRSCTVVRSKKSKGCRGLVLSRR